MRFNSKAGNLIPKLLCIIAGVSLVAFFLLNRKGELPRNAGSITSTDLTALQFEQTNKPNQAIPDKGTAPLFPPGFWGDYGAGAKINSFPFSISNPIPSEGAEADSLHFYNINLILETGAIVEIDLKEPEGADLALGIFGDNGTLAYSNNTKNGGNENIRFVITNKQPIAVAVETVTAPQTGNTGQYTLSVTSNSEEKGYLIESLPFTTSKLIQGQERVHIYQTTFPVDNGTIVGAGLKAIEDAELVLYISDEEGTLNYSKSIGKGEEEAALTFFNGGMATIIVEVNPVKSKEDQYGSYALSVNTKGVERIIENLPYTASGYMSQIDTEGKRWHWYQIASTVPAGTVISANLSVTGKANMDVTIFVDRHTISYGNNHGIDEDEHAELAIGKDSKVYVIIDNVEGEGNYSLTVTSAVPAKS